MAQQVSEGASVSAPLISPSPRRSEALRRQLAHARAVLAGTSAPTEPMPTPQAVQSLLDRGVAERGQYYTAEAARREADQLNLQAHYGGRPVACTTTPDGILVPLASGDDEIDALFDYLTPEERARVEIRHPPPFIADSPSWF